MEYILAILALPVLWIIASRFIFKHHISTKEMAIQFGVTFIFVIVAYYLSVATLTSDVELINGQITGKESVRVRCEHSYDCHCRRVTKRRSDGSTYTQRKCKTCYDHSYDVDWKVYSNVGNFEISRVNRQGTTMPPRWAAVQIGEPASTTHSYENYIKAAKLSLFNKDKALDAQFTALIPQYPGVFDYYRVNRVIPVGINVPQIAEMNKRLNEHMRWLGPNKQANIIVVIVNTVDPNYRYALERAWLGGKKNDIVVTIGVTKYPTIDWVDVITIGNNSGNEMLQVRIRDQLMYLQSLQKSDTIINVIAGTVRVDFNRKSMKDFEYLKSEIQPSSTALSIIFLLTILCNIGLSTLFFKEDF